MPELIWHPDTAPNAKALGADSFLDSILVDETKQ
jgi:hypothetical protein